VLTCICTTRKKRVGTVAVMETYYTEAALSLSFFLLLKVCKEVIMT